MKRNRINQNFIARELAADYQLQLGLVKKLVDAVFLKIVKHMMYNRPVRIAGFGAFTLVFRKPKKWSEKLNGPGMSPVKFAPKLTFSRTAKNLIEDSMKEKAEQILKEMNCGK